MSKKSKIHKEIDDCYKEIIPLSKWELYEERAAILEFDAGFEPMQAAKLARNEILNELGMLF